MEAILSGSQASELRREGIDLALKQVDGQSVAQRATLQAANGFEVFRRYGGPGGLKEEFEQAADDNRKITKLVTVGETIEGQEIIALELSKNADKDRDGKKPAVLYLGAQHAREWITPEMIRRLMHHYLDGYAAGNKTIRDLVHENELWFVPVANPDGYDWSFEPGQRLWRKNLRDNNGDGTVRLNYRINGGRTRTDRVSEWDGGERYGDENDDYYAELRGRMRGADPGDDVTVWFTGEEDRRGGDDDDDDDDDGRDRDVESERFTYTVESDSRSDVLVLANEDYTGVNPRYPAGTNAPKYVEEHVAAIEAAGYDADVWDVDAQGVPHDLGVLSHYDAVVWYLGDNRITQAPEDKLISTPFGQLPDVGVAERQQYLTMAVRDYLNA